MLIERNQFFTLMLIHHILTMASIQYEAVISVKLCYRMIELMEDIQQLPTQDAI